MRERLGPDWLVDDFGTLVNEYLTKATIQGLPHSVVLACEGDGSVVGFAEVSLRAIAEGCLTSPVGYVEGGTSTRRHGDAVWGGR